MKNFSKAPIILALAVLCFPAYADTLGVRMSGRTGGLDYLSIVTLGTVQAGKALTADANNDVLYPATYAGTISSGASDTYQSGSTLNIAGTFQVGGVSVTGTAAELNYIDLTTLGTGAASKAIVLDASGNYTAPAAGTLTLPSGYALTSASGASLTSAGSLAITGTITVDSVTVNKKALSLPGRATIRICGDGTTINNNTVYYGPSMVTVAGSGRVCDITQVGNTTEATADTPAFDATAFQVLSMDCLTADPGAAGVSFTLRNNAGATVPSVTCSVASTKLGCTANIQTTTAIASGNPIAIAAASTGNQGTTPFACAIEVAY